jgi:hypothetical protein
MTIADRHIQKRIEWIKQDSDVIRTGGIRSQVFDTKEKASRISQFAAGEVPFLKAKVTAEKILFVDFPVKSDYIDRIYVAQPMFTGITGTGCKDFPVQLACLTEHKIPNTVATVREKRKKVLFVSSEAGDDLFIKQIFKDKKLTELQWIFTHIINKDESISLQCGLQILPPTNFFGNKTLCIFSSGTIRKTLRIYGRRVYDFNNYFQWLENTVRNLKEMDYSGPVKDDDVYDLIYFIFHEELANFKIVDGNLICPKCGKGNDTEFLFCSNCGYEIKV